MSKKNVTLQLPVLDMSCAACAVNVENTVRIQPGVEEAAVNYAAHLLQVTYDPAMVRPDDLRRAVQSAGYDLVLQEEAPGQTLEAHMATNRESLRKAMWGAGLLSLPVMVLGMVWMHAEWAHWAGLALSFPVVFGYGQRFFRSAWKQARHGNANMDTLVALSTGIAWVFSAFNTVFPDYFRENGLEPHVYFEAAAVIVFFILLGKYLEENAKAHTSSALKKLLGKQPKTVWRRESGADVERPLADIRPGDTLLVRAGDHLPVDGRVQEGESLVDESSISGEAVLQLKQPGDRVFAGTLNQQGSFYLVAEQVGATTVLAGIVRTVQQAQGSKAPVQKLADRVSAVFVPTVLIIALITFLSWWMAGHFTIGLLAGVTVLVIACPCALGLATPTALMAGIGRAAEKGILIKNAESLEKARRITDIILDKTGTLTSARPVLKAQWWADHAGLEHRRILYQLERRSNHPLAGALADALHQFSEPLPLHDVQSSSGKGISAQLDGHTYRAGSPAWMSDIGVVFPDDARNFLRTELTDTGAAIVCFAEDDTLMAVCALLALPDEAALLAIRQLQQKGLTLHLLSGDQEKTVAYIAGLAGIPRFKGAVLPAEKGEYVRTLQAAGREVGMVGDGINDAEALALADVGIAMGHGADIAIDVADITLLGSDLEKLPEALELSGKTVRTIRQNLFWAFVYNLIGIPVAAGVLYPGFGFLLNPMIAGGAMAMSSVSVVLNSLRLRNF
ncbi:MAG: heavy metal translocating P-type ATPase [Saprospiraceae bacterium]|nr:heavy metal translocating P-type ATPase [Saprospiraceae bacterium]